MANLPNQHQADLVTLIVPGSSICGLAYRVEDNDSAKGFSVVKGSCATSVYALAHEIGHNLGMKHDRSHEGDFTSTKCNFGRCNSSIASIMAYTSSCAGSVRVGVYSTPKTQVFGFLGPYGFACGTRSVGVPFRPPWQIGADNQKTPIEDAPKVAAWR